MNRQNTAAILEFYADLGVDEHIVDTPVDRYAEALEKSQKPQSRPSSTTIAGESGTVPATTATPLSSPPSLSAYEPVRPAPAPLTGPGEHTQKARKMADAATSLDELRRAVESFDGCSIKRTATHTVFSDGNPESDLMLIGEAPGAEEDRQGIPFCGPSGQLLDKMFTAIGRDRSCFYISNTLFWRPPGNRKPSTEETEMCLPFVEKHIALIVPKLLVLVGGTAATALLGDTRGITRLRGQQFAYTNPYLQAEIPTVAIYHPSYLLRQPAHKRLAWQDLLKIKDILEKAV